MQHATQQSPVKEASNDESSPSKSPTRSKVGLVLGGVFALVVIYLYSGYGPSVALGLGLSLGIGYWLTWTYRWAQLVCLLIIMGLFAARVVLAWL